jgi:hypothetical protein
MDHDPCFGAQPGPTGLLLRGLTDFGSGATIVRLDVTGFAAVALSANCRAAGAGNAGPSSIQRSADGDTLSFFFDPPIDPPQGSYFLSIVTDVTPTARRAKPRSTRACRTGERSRPNRVH